MSVGADSRMTYASEAAGPPANVAAHRYSSGRVQDPRTNISDASNNSNAHSDKPARCGREYKVGAGSRTLVVVISSTGSVVGAARTACTRTATAV